MRNNSMKPACSCLLLCLPLVLLPVAGCGTNIEDVLFQVASAAGRTAVDAFVTDVANSFAGVDDVADTGDGIDNSGNGDGSTGDGGGDTVDLDTLVGDPVAGQDIFMSNNCSACHCADGVGGCALDAPLIVGVSSVVANGVLRGGDPHAGGKFNFSDQELVDLVAYMASL